MTSSVVPTLSVQESQALQVFWDKFGAVSIKSNWKCVLFPLAQRPKDGQGRHLIDIPRSHTIVNRIPLNGRSARRRDVYLTSHNIHNRLTTMPAAQFKATTSASDRPQTLALDHSATGIGNWKYVLNWNHRTSTNLTYAHRYCPCIKTWQDTYAITKTGCNTLQHIFMFRTGFKLRNLSKVSDSVATGTDTGTENRTLQEMAVRNSLT